MSEDAKSNQNPNQNKEVVDKGGDLAKKTERVVVEKGGDLAKKTGA